MTGTSKIDWPFKTHDIHSHHMDSRAWSGFSFRDSDVVIASYAKSGTTWTQQIVGQLIFGGVEGLRVHEVSPWVELRILPEDARAALDRQSHRRFMKTHLPVDALVFAPTANYIFIGRDGRDVAWSLHNHQFDATEEYFANYNEGRPKHLPLLQRGPADPRDFYREWFRRDGHPIWPFWHHVRSWWAVRNLPNVMLIHFNDLKQDLEGSIRRIAGYLEIPVDPAAWPRIIDHCKFSYMKAHAADVAPVGGKYWQGGAATFINEGHNGRWREALSEAEANAYDQRASRELGPACARWLSEGGSLELDLTISPLRSGSPELETCAMWRHTAFLRDEGYSVVDSRNQLEAIATGADPMEIALVAHAGGRVAGICMLVRKELDPTHALSPWLASLYVAPAFRRHSIGRRLVRAIEEHAREFGVARLYLYTVDAGEFYHRCGWSVAERFMASGVEVTLMTKSCEE